MRRFFVGSCERLAPTSLKVTDERTQKEHIISAEPDVVDEVVRLLLRADGYQDLEAGHEEAAQIVEFLAGEGILIDLHRCPQFAAELISRLDPATSQPAGEAMQMVRWVDARAVERAPLFSARYATERLPSFCLADLGPGEADATPSRISVEALVAASYGWADTDIHHVPSAGGLWPLAVHVVADWSRSGDDKPQLFWFDDRASQLKACELSVDLTRLRGCLVASETVQQAALRGAAVVVISADLTRVGHKYGTRGAQFALLEAGAVMQRLYESAAVHGTRVRAVGGFNPARLQELLDLELLPLLTLLTVGKEAAPDHEP